MKILFDTNVILDLFLNRQPFVEDAEYIFTKVELGELIAYLGATTITNLDYLLIKYLGKKKTNQVIKQLLKLFDIAPVNRATLEDALETKFNDFEDSVLYIAAVHSEVHAIVTRDRKGFEHAHIPVYSPKELIEKITAYNPK